MYRRAPILPLPIDIHFYIFSTTLESYSNEEYETIDYNPTVRLAQVCRFWRSIVHTCPLLWTRLVLRRRALEKGPVNIDTAGMAIAHACFALSELLSRSGQCSLDLTVMSNYNWGENAPQAVQDRFNKDFVPLLKVSAQRCKSLKIKVRSKGFFYGSAATIMEAINSSPALVELIIFDGVEPLPLSKELVAQLRSLRVVRCGPVQHAFEFGRATQLRELVMGDVSWISFLEISQCLVNLETLAINIQNDQRSTGEQLGIISSLTIQNLPVLTCLCVWVRRGAYGRSGRSAWAFFDFLSVPAMSGLRIRAGARNEPSAIAESLASFLQRSPNLDYFAYNGKYGFTNLDLVLSAIPRLRDLEITCRGIDPIELIKLLVETQPCREIFGSDLEEHTHPRFCPRLLSIMLPIMNCVPLELTVRLLASRVFGVHQVQARCSERGHAHHMKQSCSAENSISGTEGPKSWSLIGRSASNYVAPESLQEAIIFTVGGNTRSSLETLYSHPEIEQYCKTGFNLLVDNIQYRLWFERDN